ncbi:hypothetical protein QGN29_00370 [Temperatibacter marinus]|uniref:Uncharacterized protein n=1 Tax=Temperatibacter marinus TaxID=1456591 RepID=A0AA52EIT2_9PROT|nr:hypothetical protein [Temperatibacter marinus]WND02816.1 hypothetical protein QGN29_00370 [Temperatibacter marinus]
MYRNKYRHIRREIRRSRRAAERTPAVRSSANQSAFLVTVS